MFDDIRQILLKELIDTGGHDCGRVFACEREHIFSMKCGGNVCSAQDGAQILFDVIRLALLEQENGTFALAEADDLVIDDWVRDIHDVCRYLSAPERVGAAE